MLILPAVFVSNAIFSSKEVNLHESFLALDLELRNRITEIGREKK